MCLVYGYIGKYQVADDHSPRLLFVKNFERVGQLRVKSREHTVCRVVEVLLVALGSDELDSLASIECDFANLTTSPTASTPGSPDAAARLSSSASSPALGADSGKAKLERKINEEVLKIFQENGGSFYFSATFDLTNSIERQEQSPPPLADDRFFWNKVMVAELAGSRFVLPLIQGFVKIDSFTSSEQPHGPVGQVEFRLGLISRRSRFRLGTRLKRRGVDETGHVANFVETEQIIDVYDGHTLSFVIVRGSIPVFWAQTGIKYRPAPRIEKSECTDLF